MKIKKVYISGKISGVDVKEVIRKFHASADKLRRFGFEPVSPLDNGLPFPAAWEDHMGEDIKLLLKSDAIYLQSDYEESEGAQLELLIAEHRGMPIFLEDPSPRYSIKGADLVCFIESTMLRRASK